MTRAVVAWTINVVCERYPQRTDKPAGIVIGDLDAVCAWCRSENAWKEAGRSSRGDAAPWYRPMLPLDAAELAAARAAGRMPILNGGAS